MREMHLGVTGTREGMNEYQRASVIAFLSKLVETFRPDNIRMVFHHGDCVGVDIEAAEIAKGLGCKLISHPPTNKRFRGNFPSDETRKPKDYFVRDKELVNESQMLLVVPKDMEWQPRGGTWYTHDYAKDKEVFMRIFWPARKGK